VEDSKAIYVVGRVWSLLNRNRQLFVLVGESASAQ